MAKTIDNDLFQRFLQLILDRTGLCFVERDWEKICTSILSRVHACRFTDPAMYYHLLHGHTVDSEREWKTLAASLTIGESYFFRNHGQFALLRDRILPELIKQNRSDKTLRLWSVGCSTGEEPYSLAILLDELLPDRNEWALLIAGTDINEYSLARARRGCYTQWSFRRVDPEIQRRYFQQSGNEWEIDRRVRDMVKFEYSNIMDASFPDNNPFLYEMDLILCRNVFIYFERNILSDAVGRLIKTLNRRGYLITGHSELLDLDLGRLGLQSKIFPESVVYQHRNGEPSQPRVVTASSPAKARKRQVRPVSTSAPLATNQQQPAPVAAPHPERVPEPEPDQVGSILAEARSLLQRGVYREARSTAERVLLIDPERVDAHCVLAQVCANAGDYDHAIDACRRAIELDRLAVSPHILLAQIMETMGDINEAKRLWKRTIYLAPRSVAAYLELGAIYERERDTKRAKKMRMTALGLLQNMPTDACIEPYTEWTAGSLISRVQAMVEEGNGAI